jgi:hypothetical protein
VFHKSIIGTVMGFGAFSTNFEIAEKIDVFIALAPVRRKIEDK